MDIEQTDYCNWYIEVQGLISVLNNITNQYNISFDQFLLLEELIVNPGASPTDLADIFKVSTPAVSRKLKALQSKSMIVKSRNDLKDQRLVHIKVTNQGRQIYNELRRKVDDFHEHSSNNIYSR
ncbi:MarR family transcriptional regulator [Latilactobacillus sakei]|nr:MarR family transcriptional regulator [Latilactobacillus sakei]AUX11532.1 MarR family transcriptional regulator [Latilactobacillus sakei]